jgi:Matrixin
MLVLPRAPDLDMNTAMETSMWVRARPGGGERQSLLGTYPVPAPHLVGAPLPPTPGCPSRWEPPLPPLQYGIDYTFLRHDDNQPLRWRPDLPITVRIAGPHEPEQAAMVDAVVAELAGLTGLSLAVAESWPHPLALRAVSAQEIRVGFLANLPPARSFRPCAGRVGLGGAVGGPGLSHYTSGFALVATGITGPHRPSVVAVLRHELAHALGLGHAARPGLLMYHRISDATVDFGRGDRRGLFLLNEGAQPGAG